MTAKEIQTRLKYKFSYDKGYVYLTEMSTYGLSEINENRRIDGLVVSTFPSQGYWRMAIEIKVARADIIKELEYPAKSNAIYNHVNKFCLAIPDMKLIKNLDIPEHWGIMLITEKRIYYKRTPKYNKKAITDGSIVSRIASRLQAQHEEAIHKKEWSVREESDKLVREKVRVALEGNPDNVEFYKSKYEKIQKSIKVFEDLTGIYLGEYCNRKDLAKIANLTALFLRDGLGYNSYTIKSIRKGLASIEELSETVDEYRNSIEDN